MGGLPEVKLARSQPLLEFGSGRLRGVVVIQRDHVNFRATIGAPADSCLCAPNDGRRFGLNRDSGRFHRRDSLHLMAGLWNESSNGGILTVQDVQSL